jgi:hypothetical protein
MIKGKRRVELSPESVLNMVSAYDLFRFYMPTRDWKINVAVHSPFHADENPSFLIGDRGGGLHFVDFAQPDKRGGPIDFVMCRYGLSLDEALRKIDSDFGLGFISTKNVGKYKEIVSEYKQPESDGKRYSLIQVVTRKFTKLDLEYWGSYFQSEDDLRANNIYSIKEVYLNRQRHVITENLRFGYLYEGGWWKIYVPFAKTKRGKWLSNVPLTTAYGLENLDKEHNTLISKSMKDFLVCKKIYPHTMHVQNESINAFSQENVEFINNNSKEVYLGYDSDPAGKAASYIVTNAFKWKHINTPDRLLPECNDFACWAKREGLDKVEEHFRIKGLWK